MIIVISIIALIFLIVGIRIMQHAYDETPGGAMALVSGFILVLCLVFSACQIDTVISLRVIDDKIAMYQEENQNIETQIADVVEQYQKYEQDIFTEVSPESSMVLIATYPELKSDALVQQQIEIYTANNQKIKELKEQKLNAETAKWWLYFG